MAEESATLTGAAQRWLMTLQHCVRTVDYEAARPLFAPDVVSFGTSATMARGWAALKRQQWQNVWPHIRDFTFRLEELHCLGGEQGLCMVVPWDSVGVAGDGTTFTRPGRATIFLVRHDQDWVAVHSHFSLAPAAL